MYYCLFKVQPPTWHGEFTYLFDDINTQEKLNPINCAQTLLQSHRGDAWQC